MWLTVEAVWAGQAGVWAVRAVGDLGLGVVDWAEGVHWEADCNYISGYVKRVGVI